MSKKYPKIFARHPAQTHVQHHEILDDHFLQDFIISVSWRKNKHRRCGIVMKRFNVIIIMRLSFVHLFLKSYLVYCY